MYGYTYADSSSHIEGRIAAKSSVVEVWVERLNPALCEDFGWQREPDVVVQPDAATPIRKPARLPSAELRQARARARKLLRERQYDALLAENLLAHLITPTLWQGSITLPSAAEGAGRYRLAITEYEEYLVDDVRTYNPPVTRKDRRLVFMEYVNLS